MPYAFEMIMQLYTKILLSSSPIIVISQFQQFPLLELPAFAYCITNLTTGVLEAATVTLGKGYE